MDINLFELDLVQICVAILAIVIAYTIKGLSGFGAGLIAIPLLTLVLPVTVVVPTVSLLSYGANLFLSIKLRRDANWPDLWPLIPFCLCGVLLAVWLLVTINAEQLALAMGLFVMVYAIYSLLPVRPIMVSRLWAVLFGGLGGFIGALFGSSGFVYVTYLKLRPLNKTQFRATVAMALALDGTFRMSGYVASGLFTPTMLVLAGLLFPVLWLSMALGNRIHLSISAIGFNRVVSGLLFVSGAVLVAKSI